MRIIYKPFAKIKKNIAVLNNLTQHTVVVVEYYENKIISIPNAYCRRSYSLRISFILDRIFCSEKHYYYQQRRYRT